MAAPARDLEPALVSSEDEALVLWAESPEEARSFLKRGQRAGSMHKFDRTFVAKRLAKIRGNRYVGGEYWMTTDDAHVDVYDVAVAAPEPIVELVQWCTLRRHD